MKDLIKALEIFLKYGDKDYPTNCSHDMLYVCVDPELVSEEDKIELEKLSFSVATELDGFYSFKYVSC
ncbi:MAG: hypothetical protein PF569_07770 [Candidatus Woesearchaeota archaeon]|jgi:DNA-binding protein YbaB|nr:hypothetical protein [Candidatus Woesearchaeota archaeon]